MIQVTWSPDGKKLATASFDGNVDLWSVERGELIRTVGAHRGQVIGCCWSADGSRLATGGEDNILRIWNVETGKQVNRLPGHRAVINAIDWASMNDRIVSCSQDGSVRFWHPDETQDALVIPGRDGVAWSPDGSRIVSNDPRHEGEYSCSIRDSRTGQVVKALEPALHGSMWSFTWSPNARMIAARSMHNSAHIWDADSGQLVHSIPGAHVPSDKDSAAETRGIAWSPDSKQFATCGLDFLIKIWDASSGKLLQTMHDHRNVLGSVCWSPDGRWFASAEWGRDVKIRASDTWQVRWEIDQDPSLVGAGAGGDYTITWGPDSHHLAAVSASGQIVVWKLLEAKKIQKLWAVEAHTSNIRTIAWSGDGRRIASGSEDRTVKIWDAATGRELLTLDGFSGMVTSVVWSPDSRRLAATDEESLRIWDATEAYETTDLLGVNK